MNNEVPAYGLWGLAFINAAVFIMFAFSFFKPKTKRDWRTFSTFSAFIVAMSVEMYGFPVTIYLLSRWLQTRFPGTDFLSHDAGHIWYSLLGFKGDPHLNPIHLASNVLIVGRSLCHRACDRGGTHEQIFGDGLRFAEGAVSLARHRAGDEARRAA